MRISRKTISAATLLVCAIAFYFYIRDHLSEFSSISDVSVQYVILIGCASLAGLIVNGLFLKVLLDEFGIRLGFSEYFSISILTSFGNVFLPMKGGAGFKAVYLKSKYNYDYSYFVAGLAGNYLVCFNVTALTALAGMGLYWSGTGYFNIPAAAVFIGIAVAAFWVIFFPPRAFDWIPLRWARAQANQVLSGWNTVRKSGRTVAYLFILASTNVFISSVMCWLEFSAFGMRDAQGLPIGIAQSAVFSAIGSLAVFIGLTPAALGVRESLLMFSSEILGISPAQALTASLLDRTVSFLVLAMLFSFASIYIKKQLNPRVAACKNHC
ncbi:MAG: lysylphosphatidylglycerol synthase transmembrane domain-containing protein [Syntrophobacter sp.]